MFNYVAKITLGLLFDHKIFHYGLAIFGNAKNQLTTHHPTQSTNSTTLFHIPKTFPTFAVPERRYIGNYDHYQRKRRRIIRQSIETLQKEI